jgi:hypothetical protein
LPIGELFICLVLLSCKVYNGHDPVTVKRTLKTSLCFDSVVAGFSLTTCESSYLYSLCSFVKPLCPFVRLYFAKFLRSTKGHKGFTKEHKEELTNNRGAKGISFAPLRFFCPAFDTIVWTHFFLFPTRFSQPGASVSGASRDYKLLGSYGPGPTRDWVAQ